VGKTKGSSIQLHKLLCIVFILHYHNRYKNCDFYNAHCLLYCQRINISIGRTVVDDEIDERRTSLKGFPPCSSMPSSLRACFQAPKLLKFYVAWSSVFILVLSALFSMRATRFSQTTAQKREVRPASSLRFGLVGPCLRRRSTDSTERASPWYAAHIKEVCP
jgi:hypothetical protein